MKKNNPAKESKKAKQPFWQKGLRALRWIVGVPVGLVFGYFMTFYAFSGEKLTPGEKKLSQQFFGAQLNADRVRKHHRPEGALTQKATAIFIGHKRGVTLPLTSHIDFYGNDLRIADFSTAAVDAFDLFMHEMTHVWQNQECLNTRGIGHYPYDIRPGMAFKDFGVEQQASMVEDYVRHFIHRDRAKTENYNGRDANTDAAYDKIKTVVEAQFPNARDFRLKREAEFRYQDLLKRLPNAPTSPAAKRPGNTRAGA